LMTAPMQVHEKQRQQPRAAAHLAWVRKGRVPCLDGVRAISILLVVLDHSHNTIRPATLKPPLWLFAGHLGVTCFFVII